MTHRRSALFAALLLGLGLRAAPARAQSGGATELSEEQARIALPRADLSGLNGAQRAQLLEIASDSFDYAGCNDTLARCLAANVTDKHAVRMAEVLKWLLLDGVAPRDASRIVDEYYGSFAANKRHKVDATDCASLGPAKAPITAVEFSDFQCPHCAASARALKEFVEAAHGSVRLCSKYFPLPQHPRARPAAACAEFARRKGKFWEMSDLLFEHQEQLDDEQLQSFAKQLHLDGGAMLKAVYANTFDAVIAKHLQQGSAADVQETPTLFLNGRKHRLPLKLNYLLRSAEDEAEWQKGHGHWQQ